MKQHLKRKQNLWKKKALQMLSIIMAVAGLSVLNGCILISHPVYAPVTTVSSEEESGSAEEFFANLREESNGREESQEEAGGTEEKEEDTSRLEDTEGSGINGQGEAEGSGINGSGETEGSEVSGSEEFYEEVPMADYTFRKEKYLTEHFEKHGGEFPYDTKEDYLAGANRVIASPNALTKTEAEDGDYVFYLEETNEFVILSTDGYIRTYFKPSGGRAYFDRQ